MAATSFPVVAAVVAGLVVHLVSLGVVLAAGARRAGVAPGRAARLGAALTSGFLAWALVSAGLALDGSYVRAGQAVPVLMAVMVATLAGGLLLAATPPVAALLRDPAAPETLVRLQTVRLVGGVFLVVLAAGELPAMFALPAGLGDVAVGLAAPLVARRVRAGTGDRAVLWFSAAGLLDFVVAVGTGFAAAPTVYRLVTVTPSTEALLVLPLALIPTIAVPVLTTLHVLSLRCRRERVVTPGALPEAPEVTAR